SGAIIAVSINAHIPRNPASCPPEVGVAMWFIVCACEDVPFMVIAIESSPEDAEPELATCTASSVHQASEVTTSTGVRTLGRARASGLMARPPWSASSLSLTEDADPADLDLLLVREFPHRDDAHRHVVVVEQAVSVQLVHDLGDVQDVGEPPARVLSVRVACRAQPERRHRSGEPVGV